MAAAIRVFVRYDTPDEHGIKRRDKNDDFNIESPPLVVPPAVRYLWEWYFELSSGLRRVRDGVCEPIPALEFQAWREATGHIVYPVEYGILRAMDVAFCDETNKELSAFREREAERREQEAESRKRRGR